MRNKFAPLLALVLCAGALLFLSLPVSAASNSGIIQVEEESQPEPSQPEPPPAVEAKYKITIVAPSGWYTKSASVTIRLEDIGGTGFEKAEVKTGQNGKWQDITDDLTDDFRAAVSITDNDTIYVAVTDPAGTAHIKSLYIECFDRDAPTIKAKLDGRTLWVEAQDSLSGIASIYVNGYEFDDHRDGALDIRVKEYVEKDEQEIFVYAADEAGNRSKTVTVKNPYYEEPREKEKEKESSSASSSSSSAESADKKPSGDSSGTSGSSSAGSSSSASTTTPTTTAPIKKPEPAPVPETQPEESESAVPEESKPFTPDGTGSVLDNVLEQNGKEFFTIATEDDNIFYLIVDRERDSDGVYLLNAVTENDLLALAQPSPDNTTESVIPTPEPEPTPTPAPADPEPEPEPVPEESGKGFGSMLILILAVLAVGGAGYYLKILKPRRGAALLGDEDEEDEGEYGEADSYFDDEYEFDSEESGDPDEEV